MEDKNKLIKDVLEEKYGFTFRPGLDSPPMIMDEELTIEELIEEQNALKQQNCQIGVNLTSSVLVLGRTKKLPLMAILLYNHLWIFFLIISIALFFISWIYGVLCVILTIKEYLSPFYRYKLRSKIVTLALTDYESLYMLLAMNSIRVKG